VPDGELIGRLLRRFVYTRDYGMMQVATLIIATRIGAVTRPVSGFLPSQIIGVIALVVIGGTYIAAHILREVPLSSFDPGRRSRSVAPAQLPIAERHQRVRVAPARYAWSLAGYGVIAALLTYVFVRSDVPGDVMGFLAAMLVIYALDIPLLFGFSVARYQPIDAVRGTS
jgi:hypothetical protein